jgi:molecular chaperone GrpE
MSESSVDTDSQDSEQSNEEELKFPNLDGLEDSEGGQDSIDHNSGNQGLEVIAKLEADLRDAQSKYLYAMAEMDNIKKRHFKERSELVKYQGESISSDLLEVLDDLERVSAVPADTNSETILEGLQLITSRMRAIFERYSIKSEECAGLRFDPAKHEALTMVNSDEIESGNIIQVIKKCYYYKDKLLRVAQVVVSNGPKKESETQE